MKIRTILFDADGVLQRPGAGLMPKLAEMAGGETHLDGFVSDLYAAEDRCLAGTSDFHAEVSAVLARREYAHAPDDVIAALNDIRADEAILARIAALRASGMLCCLATNQQAYRARYMSATLGYAARFDREFYSCELGAAKPAEAYFAAILRALGTPREAVLFIDDREENVAAARQAGIHAAAFERNSGIGSLDRLLGEFGIG